jgi:hypothetical protein
MVRILERLQTLVFDTRTRVILTIFLFIATLISTSLGVILFRADVSEAQELREKIFEDFERANDPRFIFGNNLLLTLVMFVPIIGPIWGLLILFNTGSVIALISIAEGFPPILTFVILFLTPVFWLELGVYSIAMAQSIVFFLRFLQNQVRKESVRTCVIITACTLLLMLAAIIEWLMISLSSNL